ncbi:hypothetical protein PYCCODRAFT_377106 [Trametes coccinea BRFM310]|uniref:Uncharacterized protein n=1 Tax=Trametes coccinea (strain BRFM310) TaxID=1353009 RepID=A0A1Y2J3L9_TRAC3|nr:hypothetical protein PYCCODRAFT_377106 [Trametes coccinea BRFM310]
MYDGGVWKTMLQVDNIHLWPNMPSHKSNVVSRGSDFVQGSHRPCCRAAPAQFGDGINLRLFCTVLPLVLSVSLGRNYAGMLPTGVLSIPRTARQSLWSFFGLSLQAMHRTQPLRRNSWIQFSYLFLPSVRAHSFARRLLNSCKSGVVFGERRYLSTWSISAPLAVYNPYSGSGFKWAVHW